MFKIKLLISNDSIKFWYVKSIKRGNKGFAGTTELSEAKVYRKTKAVNELLDYFLENNVNYVLMDTIID